MRVQFFLSFFGEQIKKSFIADMVLYTPQFKRKNNQNASTDCADRCWLLYVPM